MMILRITEPDGRTRIADASEHEILRPDSGVWNGMILIGKDIAYEGDWASGVRWMLPGESVVEVLTGDGVWVRWDD